jgi:hypothetical protein
MNQAINPKEIRSLSDVVRFMQESWPDWIYEPENTWNATAVLLISAAVLETTYPVTLAQFTGYDIGFVCGVAWNMMNNGVWTCIQYKPKHWSVRYGIGLGSPFGDEVGMGMGDTWDSVAEIPLSVDLPDPFGSSFRDTVPPESWHRPPAEAI